MSRIRSIVAVVTIAAAGASVWAERVEKTDKTGRSREVLVDYYVRLYGKSLKSSDWITRSMAVISLAKIDDPRVTDVLLDVMANPYSRTKAAAKKAPLPPPKLSTADAIKRFGLSAGAAMGTTPNDPTKTPMHKMGSNIVQVMAWEALHARTGSLSDAQRKKWIEGTVRLAQRNQFHGQMRPSMLRALAGEGPTRTNMAVWVKTFAATNALYSGDANTLRALRDVLVTWRSPVLVKGLIGAMARSLDNAPRADWLLRGFGAGGVPHPTKYVEKGTNGLWPNMQKAWVKWYNDQRLEPAKPDALSPYRGTSDLVPTAQTIDPADDKWRKDLELPRLHLKQLDVGFVIDSTGSMKAVVNWIKRDVRKMLWALALLSREPRIGVTFFRDHGDKYVTQLHPLTGNGAALTRAIERTEAAGGEDVPEAVLDGLAVTILKQRWSGPADARKVIVLVGDAPPHKRDMANIQKLVTTAARKGWTFYCIKARTQHGSAEMGSFDRIAKWGKGKSVWVDFHDGGRQKQIYEGAAHVDVTLGASDGSSDSTRPDRVIIRAVLKSILTDAYADRVQPFSNVLLEYLETPVKETRKKVLSPEEKKRLAAKRRSRGKGRGKKGGGKKKGPQGR